MSDVYLKSPSSIFECIPSGDICVDPGCIPKYSFQCFLALSIDNVDIKFKRSKCHWCIDTTNDCPCLSSPRDCIACCGIACNDIPDYAPNIDPLINDHVIFFYSSTDLGNGEGNLDGDIRGLINDGYCTYLMSISLDDKFCNTTHCAPKWVELSYLTSSSDRDLSMLFCETSCRTQMSHYS